MKAMRPVKLLLASAVVVLSAVSICAQASSDVNVRLEPINFNLRDMDSVKRGAKHFAAQCMVCHAMRFLDHNPLAKQAGITIDKMPLKDQEWWFGTAPPDLSLIARVRSPRWIYTYLHAFYKDESRKLGSNNLLFPNSNMPNPFAGMQGEQVLAVDADQFHTMGGVFATKPRYFSLLRMEKQGSMSADEFHQQIYDIVNFLVYASEPARAERTALGWWVLGFLLLLMALTYLLKKEYWKDIK